MELATFCELFAQLRETTGERCGSAREFVDRVQLPVHCLNAIVPGSIGDRAHIAILLAQIGPEYVLIVDGIQNDKDPVNPTTIGNHLSNAEQTVRRKESPTPPQAGSARRQYGAADCQEMQLLQEARPCGRAMLEGTARSTAV
jgi:hypothetical protein